MRRSAWPHHPGLFEVRSHRAPAKRNKTCRRIGRAWQKNRNMFLVRQMRAIDAAGDVQMNTSDQVPLPGTQSYQPCERRCPIERIRFRRSASRFINRAHDWHARSNASPSLMRVRPARLAARNPKSVSARKAKLRRSQAMGTAKNDPAKS